MRCKLSTRFPGFFQNLGEFFLAFVENNHLWSKCRQCGTAAWLAQLMGSSLCHSPSRALRTYVSILRNLSEIPRCVSACLLESACHLLKQWSFFTGVDLMIWAHEHSYERLFPLYKMQVTYRTFWIYKLKEPCFVLWLQHTLLFCCRFAMDHGKSHTPTLAPQSM